MVKFILIPFITCILILSFAISTVYAYTPSQSGPCVNPTTGQVESCSTTGALHIIGLGMGNQFGNGNLRRFFFFQQFSNNNATTQLCDDLSNAIASHQIHSPSSSVVESIMERDCNSNPNPFNTNPFTPFSPFNSNNSFNSTCRFPPFCFQYMKMIFCILLILFIAWLIFGKLSPLKRNMTRLGLGNAGFNGTGAEYVGIVGTAKGS